MTPFRICVGAGETLDLEFQLATKNDDSNDRENATLMIQLKADGIVVAESMSNSDRSSSTLLFRGKVMTDTEFTINLEAAGSQVTQTVEIGDAVCQLGYRIYPECYTVSGEGNCPAEI